MREANAWTGNETHAGTETFNGPVALNDGGSLNGTFTGSPNLSGNPTFSGNPIFTGSPNLSSATPVWPPGIQSLNVSEQSILFVNNTGSGTNMDGLVKLTGAPSTATFATTSDTGGIVGICIANCSMSGSATIQINGLAICQFDGATVAGDYIVNSSTNASNCHDAGASFPSSGQVIGRTLSTNAASGLYGIDLFPAEINRSSVTVSSGPTNFGSNIGPNTVVASTTVGTYAVFVTLEQSRLGVGCGAGSNVANISIGWTDAYAGFTNSASQSLTISANGVLGNAATSVPSGSVPGLTYVVPVSAAGTITYLVSSTLASAGCSTVPQWTATAKALN